MRLNEIQEGIYEDVVFALKRGEDVVIPGFGRFSAKRANVKVPNSGFDGKVMAPPSKISVMKVYFKPYKKLKEALNG